MEHVRYDMLSSMPLQLRHTDHLFEIPMSTGIGESRPSCCEGPTLQLPVMDEARRAKARGPKGPERGYGFLGKGQLAGAKFGGPIPPLPPLNRSMYWAAQYT